MKITNYKKIGLWSLVIIVVVAIALPNFIDSNPVEDSSKANLQKKSDKKSTINVNGLIVEFEEQNKSIFASGTLLSDEEVDIRTEVAGKIVKLNIKEGDYVNKGDLLVKLNDNDLQAQLKKALERHKLLELTESRQKSLYEKQGISRQEYDIAASELSSQRAEIEYIKAMIERTEVKSPFSGVIGLRNFSEGAYISPSDIISRLQKVDFLKIDFSIPQKYYSNIRKGSNLSFRIPPDTNHYVVSVLATEPKIDETTRTFKIRGRFSNNSSKLVPGSYAEVNIITNENQNSIFIPSFALIPDLSSEYVLVYENGIATKRNVRTGTRTTEKIEIVSGLNPGDTLIISGIMQLRPGAPVNVNINKNPVVNL
jgi:membrane fusion protein (multidrug efflux system)